MTFLLLVGIIADENRIIVWKIKCMKKLTKKHIFICIAALLVIAAAAVYILSRTGATELTQFNSASMMDWKLGGSIDGITNVKDARSYDPEHFEYFTDRKDLAARLRIQHKKRRLQLLQRFKRQGERVLIL